MINKEEKDKVRQDFEKRLLYLYSGATIYENGKLLMKNGKVLDKEFWDKKVEKAWKKKRRGLTRRGRGRKMVDKEKNAKNKI